MAAVGGGGPAAQRWREGLEAWAVPPGILAAAPRSPFGFSVTTFDRAADEALKRRTPTSDTAAGALPAGGTVLDIGCGAGAASLPLADTAGLILGQDASQEMLAAFAARAQAMGVTVQTFAGRWPDTSGAVPPADVVVCRNVAYNVPDLDVFAATMTDHARSRAVLELTERHPMTWMTPLWEAVHDVSRPDRPTLGDAVAVLEELGLSVSVQRWDTPWLLASEPEDRLVEFVLHRLCLPDDRAGDVRDLLQHHPVPPTQPTATVWWDGSA